MKFILVFATSETTLGLGPSRHFARIMRLFRGKRQTFYVETICLSNVAVLGELKDASAPTFITHIVIPESFAIWSSEGKMGSEYEWMDRWMSEWGNEWVGEWINGWVNEWRNEWMNVWMYEWMNGQVGRRLMWTQRMSLITVNALLAPGTSRPQISSGYQTAG